MSVIAFPGAFYQGARHIFLERCRQHSGTPAPKPTGEPCPRTARPRCATNCQDSAIAYGAPWPRLLHAAPSFVVKAPVPADRCSAAQFSPAVARNRDPILAVLRRHLPERGTVLEVASGTGEHAAFFAGHCPQLVWQPSDVDPNALSSIAAHRMAAGLPNLRAPLTLDVTARRWPLARADAVLSINMIHIAPWAAAEGLFSGAARLTAGGAVLYLYGPFKEDGEHTAPSNAAFDASLRAHDPRWGVRDIRAVAALAAEHGFALIERVAMPANNLSLVFRKTQPGKEPDR
ncbi:MAG: DUF938 domain-containing protein [Hyphomicrobiales bacterium]|nr:DUF938 domain-containing protein [Hyphomicrobiales bacterium]